MSKQKILTIAGVVLLVVLVITTFVFKGKYDDISLQLDKAIANSETQTAADAAQIEELNKQLITLQTEAEAAKTTIGELTDAKNAAEKQAAELEADRKEIAEALAAESKALKAAGAEANAATAALSESEASLKAMAAQYNRAKADLDAKITRYNIVRESHAKLAEKYDLLTIDNAANKAQLEAALEEKASLEANLKALEAELEKLTSEAAEPERYESRCGVSFVLPEGAKIGNESSKMVEILIGDGASIKINRSPSRVNLLWYDAEIEVVNQLAATLVLE